LLHSILPLLLQRGLTPRAYCVRMVPDRVCLRQVRPLREALCCTCENEGDRRRRTQQKMWSMRLADGLISSTCCTATAKQRRSSPFKPRRWSAASMR
jgi:hypothetical protein